MIRRWLIRALALTLLTLCIVAWVGSYRRDTFIKYGGKGLSQLGVSNGKLYLYHCDDEPLESGSGWALESEDITFSRSSWLEPAYHALGFSYLYRQETAVSNVGGLDLGPLWIISVPLYFPTLLSALLLWLVWRKTRPKYNGRGFPVEAAGKEAANP